jgi:cytochrome P450
MLSAEINGRRVTVEEGMDMSTLLFFGGLDTVASELGFVMQFLATHPEHRHFLIENPDKIPIATEELLRRFGLSNTIRIITEDYDFNGYPLKKDEAIMVPISLASMDDEYWDNAMEVDFSRKFKSMDTFGNGPHKCPGSNLARSEIQIFLEEWLKRIPEFTIAAGRQARTATGSVPCVTELPLEWPVD